MMSRKYLFFAALLLFAGYYIAKYAAVYVLENKTKGLSVAIAQAFFAPDDLFFPAGKIRLSRDDILGHGIQFEFSAKYVGPYMIGISGINNGALLIPDSIHASLECRVHGDRYRYNVDTVSIYSGTSHSGKGAVLGIFHVENKSIVECSMSFNEIGFDGLDISDYQIVATRMYVK